MFIGMQPVPTSLEIGDKVYVLADFQIKHYGICIVADWFREPRIVHNVKACAVIETDLKTFSGGRPVNIEYRARNWMQAIDIVQRARSLMGTPYDFFNFNCEQAANFAAHGQPVSLQLRQAFGLFALGGLALLIAGAARR